MRTRFAQNLAGILARSAPAQDAHLFALKLAAKTAAPDKPPPEFSWHDYAVFLLSMAAEIEHSLMVQYLYAAYSLGGDQVPEKDRKDVLDWQQTILGIAKEEMGHFVTVQNVLKLLGGPLHLDREDYPWISPFHPFEFTLECLSAKSLAKYVVAESPAEWPDDVPKDERKQIEELAQENAGSPVNRVGTLYTQMIDILSDAKKVPDHLFRPETYPFQASWDEWGRGYVDGKRGSTPKSSPNVLVIRASSRTQAIGALQAVAEQGEAVTVAQVSEDSHFRRFLKVYREFSAVKTWSPTLPVAKDPRVPILATPTPAVTVPQTQSPPAPVAETDGGAMTIKNPQAVRWGGLFNLRYRMLLSYLAHAFQLSDDPAQNAAPGRRGQVVNRIFAEMYNLKAIAGLLTRLPLTEENEPTRAGPPFQMPYTLNFPTAELDFWRLHLDLIEASDAQRSAIVEHTSGAGLAYVTTLGKADQQTRVEIKAILQPGQASSRFIRSTGNVR